MTGLQSYEFALQEAVEYYGNGSFRKHEDK